MNKMLRTVGATSVTTVLRDFLKVRHDQDPYTNAEYIVVDPSCSGSGIVSRMDDLVQDENVDNSARLKGLAGFQTAVLSHAISFTKVKKAVNSTWSIHKEENEDVVEKACKRFASTFKLAEILPEWTNRGIGEWEDAKKCLRADPHADYCNGFFVALFERTVDVVASENSDVKPEGKNADVTHVKKEEKGRKRKHGRDGKVEKTEPVNAACNETVPVPAPFSCPSNPKKKKKKK